MLSSVDSTLDSSLEIEVGYEKYIISGSGVELAQTGKRNKKIFIAQTGLA